MATVEELLASLNSSEERVCVIDNDLRKINIPKTITALGVEMDDDVHRLYFKMPRTYSGTDLSTFNIRINYLNANDEGDIYVVADKQVTSSAITFSWLVGPHALVYKGDVKFIVCLKESDANGTILREYNTTIATLPVLEGLEVDASPLEGELVDILEQLVSLSATKVAVVEAAGAEQVQKVQEKSVEEQENIKGTADYIRSTFGNDYETTVKLQRTRANAIVSTAEGEIVTIDDGSDDPLRGLRVFGKSTQVKTNGYQLFNASGLSSKTNLGATVTNNGDGSFTISGNGTFTGTYSNHTYDYSHEDTVRILRPGMYTLKSEKVTNPYAYVQLRNTSGSIINLTNSTNPEYENTITQEMLDDESVFLRVGFYGVEGTSIVPGTISPMLYIDGNGTWEPYSGGYTSPSPNWSQPIENVDSPTVSVYGNNMFDIAKFVANARAKGVLTAIQQIDDSVQVMVTSYLESYTKYDFGFQPNTQYSISFDSYWDNATNDTAQFSILFTYTDGTNTAINISYADGAKTYFATTTAGKTVETIAIGTWRYAGLCVLSNINLVKGVYDTGTMLPYETCAPNTIQSERSLQGVPVSSGGNYTDENGQQWVCDEIDFERGVYVQRILVQEFTGNETWTTNPLAESLGVTAYHIYTSSGDTEFALGVCSHFANGGQWSSGLNSKTNVFWTANTTTTVFKTDGNQSLDDFRAFVRSEYETGNPITLYSVLRTPIETPLSDAELAAFNNLHSNYPNTTVMNDVGATMQLKYNVDTKTYLDNCFRPTDDQVQAAVDAWLTAKYASAEGAKF